MQNMNLIHFLKFTAPGICLVWGDPHYLTFDSKKYSYQGDCEYTLVRDCDDEAGIPSFHLVGNNFKKQPSDTFTYQREIYLFYGNDTYTLSFGRVVHFNNQTVTLPFTSGNGVSIYLQHPYVVSIKMISKLRAKLDVQKIQYSRETICLNFSLNCFSK